MIRATPGLGRTQCGRFGGENLHHYLKPWNTVFNTMEGRVKARCSELYNISAESVISIQ